MKQACLMSKFMRPDKLGKMLVSDHNDRAEAFWPSASNKVRISRKTGFDFVNDLDVDNAAVEVHPVYGVAFAISLLALIAFGGY